MLVADMKTSVSIKDKLEEDLQEKAREIRKLKITVEQLKEKDLLQRLMHDKADGKENFPPVVSSTKQQ